MFLFCLQVSMEDVENFRKNIHQIRYPENIFQFFAFRGGHQYFLNHNSHKDKNNVAKYATIRGLASKTIKNVFTNKKTRKHSNKFILPNIMPTSDNKIFEEDEDGSENTRPGKYNFHFHFFKCSTCNSPKWPTKKIPNICPSLSQVYE